jgi:ribosomal protein S18 acetylase RimI-like enzyme
VALLVAAGDAIFDEPVTEAGAAAFLADPSQVLVIARSGGQLVGFASGAFLRHPDKPRSLFVHEVGVAEHARRRGIAGALVTALRDLARQAGCSVVWVATEHDNAPARALYRALGGTETEGVVMYEWNDDG